MANILTTKNLSYRKFVYLFIDFQNGKGANRRDMACPDACMGNGLQKWPARPACTVDAAVFVEPGLRILLGEPVCIVALQHDLAHLLQRPAVSGIGFLPPKLHDVGCHPAERVLTLDNGKQQLRRAE